MLRRSPVQVRTPTAKEDRPRWMQVGVVAAVFFAIGALWPTLAGVRLVPEAPNRQDAEPKAAPKPERKTPPRNDKREVAVSGLAAMGDPEAAPDVAEGPQALIDKTLVVNCHDADKRRLTQCDQPAFDEVAEPRLRALATCEAAKGANGVLSIGFELDFEKEQITRVLKGKSTTLPDDAAKSLIECAKREFASATLRGVAHTHARYLVFYLVSLKPAGIDPEAAEGKPIVAASGSATVIWNSAQIRATPETGDVKVRLLYGTRVIVTGRQDSWYRVRYDGQGNEGWVHQNALAL